MYYTVYKTTNLINGKFYIGKHQTQDLNDDYFGSGILINRAIKKHGIENFVKEILYIFDIEQEMNLAEKILVVIDSEVSYNICKGGQGGFSYINENNLAGHKYDVNEAKKYSKLGTIALIKKRQTDKNWADLYNKKVSKATKGKYKVCVATFKGRHHTFETKQKMSLSHKNELNSQYGTMWITNGVENKKMKKDDVILYGWHKGRV